MKHLKLYEELVQEIDGSKYFEFDSIEMNGSFKNPIYFMLSKREQYSLIYMSPLEYLTQVSIGFGSTVDHTLKSVNMDLVKKYISDMKRGDKFPIGFFIVNSSSQEGRHRAVAMMEMGVTKFPVVKIEMLTNTQCDQIATSFIGMSSSEIDEKVKKMGYRGASELDLRTIKNYIEHRL